MPKPETEALLRAVQYLRMSTEHQRYSFENQSAVIAAYALDRGMDVIRTYSDAGKSGLTLKDRKGLQKLLSDALSPDRDFAAILVLDVSRWGRFQDTDQAGHYEFMCREAGASVAYCAEPFENDGGMISAIAKSLKRIMAAEYSRELSTKIGRAKRQQAGLGFRQGAAPPYGFRRQLLAGDGSPLQVLSPGQRKALQTDRVISTLGPADEVAVARRIFRLYLREGANLSAIARLLEAEQIPSSTGRPWNGASVRRVMQNELWIGNYIYSRTTKAMRAPVIHQPESEWVRTSVMPATISSKTFREAASLRALHRTHHYSDRDLLEALESLLKREGRLTGRLISAAADMPCTATYLQRFGKLSTAYARIGYVLDRVGWDAEHKRRWTDAAVLEGVRALQAKYGYVSAPMLNAEPGMLGASGVRSRFGTLKACYARAGLPSTQSDIVRATNLRRKRKAEAPAKGMSGAIA